jgi:hypothetical protein
MKNLNPDEKATKIIEALTPQPFENWQATKEIQEIANQISAIIHDPALEESEKSSKIYHLIKEDPGEKNE